ncbi:cell wall-binding repeat-containing protein [Clostridium sp. HV4-5-A1G]|uniref:cell wall-binding repeat-containing protein n=1 Tax=Clostridium sp. HV4-5-A1G TaxID=2004595 RepID=UPI00123B1202|nr:cell wall-binding repeat-containing protein [Clostridium sp. HV4-5-A1G]KAA8671570.1 cell wall-binding repeat-containing protein [Clostridium sp. HV4-5-A1G]
MIRKNKIFSALVIGIFLASSAGIVLPRSVSAAVPRLGGQNRYETSAKVSQSGWDTSSYVILASGENYPDALCAAPLAKKYSAPILLTTSGALDANAKNEIIRLKAEHVIEIGGTASISLNIENELKEMGLDTQRIGGADRFETSVKVAEALKTSTNVVVTSAYGFADALSIAPVAASESMPILLTGAGSLPDSVKNYIAQNKASIENSYVIGGSAVVNDSVLAQLPSSERISGQNRFDTNLNVLDYFKSKLKFDNIYVVQADGPTGKEFADALSASALAAKTASPLVLTYNSVSIGIENFLKSNVPDDVKVTAVGGTAAVPESIVSSLQSLLEGNTTNPGGGGGGSQSDYDLFSSVLTKLKTIDISGTSTLNADQKEIISDVVDSMGKYLADQNYDYSQDAKTVKALFDNLSDKEKTDLESAVFDSGVTISEGLALEAKFGV